MAGGSTYKYYLDGPLYMGGKINLILNEPSTGEKLWVKSINLDDKSVMLNTQKYPLDQFGKCSGCFTDPGYLNPMQNAMNEYYQKALTTAWRYLEPQELQALKEQVRAIRAKKTY